MAACHLGTPWVMRVVRPKVAPAVGNMQMPAALPIQFSSIGFRLIGQTLARYRHTDMGIISFVGSGSMILPISTAYIGSLALVEHAAAKEIHQRHLVAENRARGIKSRVGLAHNARFGGTEQIELELSMPDLAVASFPYPVIRKGNPDAAGPYRDG